MNDYAYGTSLARNEANHVALSPLRFTARTADINPERTPIVHGAVRRGWRCFLYPNDF